MCQYFEHNLGSVDFQIFVLNIEPASLKNFGAQNIGMFSKGGKPMENLHLKPFERLVYAYPNKFEKLDYALEPILQSINIASNILGGDPEVLEISTKSKKTDIGGLEIKNDQAPKFNCFIKILDKNFAFAIILNSKIPQNIGFYARSSLQEFVSSRFDLKFHTLFNTLRSKEFANKYSF